MGIKRSDLVVGLKNYINRDPEAFGFRRKVSIAGTERMMDAFVEALCMAIRDNNKVYINKLGTFRHVKRKSRRILHPETGEEIILPDRELITFELAANFCEGVEDLELDYDRHSMNYYIY